MNTIIMYIRSYRNMKWSHHLRRILVFRRKKKNSYRSNRSVQHATNSEKLSKLLDSCFAKRILKQHLIPSIEKTTRKTFTKGKKEKCWQQIRNGGRTNHKDVGTYFLFLSFLNLITAKYKSFMCCTASGVAGVCVKLETV